MYTKYKLSLYLILFLLNKYNLFSQADSCKYLTSIAIEEYSKHHYKKSLYLFNKVLSMPCNDLIIAQTLNDIANIYTYLNLPDSAIYFYLNALDIWKKQNNIINIAKCYKNIGILYQETGNSKLSIQYYNEAEKIAVSVKDTNLIADCLNSKAVVYDESGDTYKSIEYYTKALNLYHHLKDTNRVILVLNNLGVANKNIKQNKSAKDYYIQSLFLSKLKKDTFMMIANYINLGNLMNEIYQYNNAINYFNLSLNLLNKLPVPLLEYNAYEGLALSYEKTKNYKEALKYYTLFNNKKLEHINEERNNTIAELEKKYEAKENALKIKDLSIANLKKRQTIESQSYNIKIKNYFITFFIIILFLLSILFYYYRINEKRKNAETIRKKIEETEKYERERISKDLHDEIGAGLSKILLLTQITIDESKKNKDCLNYLTSIAENAKKTSHNIKELVWLLNAESLTTEQLIIRLKNNISNFLDKTNIKFNLDYSDDNNKIIINKDICRNLSAIIYELLQNTIKHSKANNIKLNVIHKNESLRFQYIDNGIGFNLSHIKKGNGLSNINYRLTQINGKMDIDSSENGSVFNIIIKI